MSMSPNQSFERTGLGARGSLRSVGVVLARRSAQIRQALRSKSREQSMTEVST